MITKEEIKSLRDIGLNFTDIAKKFGVSRQLIHQKFHGYKTPSQRGIRNKVLDRDNSTCRNCGRRKYLHVHHIDGNSKNNQMENLITYCKKCHGRADAENYRNGITTREKSIFHIRKPKVQINCKQCGNIFLVYPSMVSRRKCCSKGCADKAHDKHNGFRKLPFRLWPRAMKEEHYSQQKKWREKNKDKVNELNRRAMKRYQAKKKREQ